MPEARSHNDLRDSQIALVDRDRSKKRQLAKLPGGRVIGQLRDIPKALMTTTPGALGVGEPLTNESGWDEVPNDHMVLIDSDHTVTMREIS